MKSLTDYMYKEEIEKKLCYVIYAPFSYTYNSYNYLNNKIRKECLMIVTRVKRTKTCALRVLIVDVFFF